MRRARSMRREQAAEEEEEEDEGGEDDLDDDDSEDEEARISKSSPVPPLPLPFRVERRPLLAPSPSEINRSLMRRARMASARESDSLVDTAYGSRQLEATYCDLEHLDNTYAGARRMEAYAFSNRAAAAMEGDTESAFLVPSRRGTDGSGRAMEQDDDDEEEEEGVPVPENDLVRETRNGSVRVLKQGGGCDGRRHRVSLPGAVEKKSEKERTASEGGDGRLGASDGTGRR
jgi:hypothetical protein